MSNRIHSICRDQTVFRQNRSPEELAPQPLSQLPAPEDTFAIPSVLKHETDNGKASRRKAAVAIQRVLDTARNAIQTVAGAKEFRVRSDLPQEEKISHALSALLETEVPDGSSLAEYRAALAFIVIAWNISLLEADKRAAALEDFAATIDETDSAMRREALGHIERLIIRKQAMFPNDMRTVVSWEVRFQGDFVRLSSAALAPSP